ncbi:hypothetical protein HYR54_14840 [Candidatus Acetothermia bacterium]|nr:hypothetical protein [Candidatus Acetothermia bacterium]
MSKFCEILKKGVCYSSPPLSLLTGATTDEWQAFYYGITDTYIFPYTLATFESRKNQPHWIWEKPHRFVSAASIMGCIRLLAAKSYDQIAVLCQKGNTDKKKGKLLLSIVRLAEAIEKAHAASLPTQEVTALWYAILVRRLVAYSGKYGLDYNNLWHDQIDDRFDQLSCPEIDDDERLSIKYFAHEIPQFETYYWRYKRVADRLWRILLDDVAPYRLSFYILNVPAFGVHRRDPSTLTTEEIISYYLTNERSPLRRFDMVMEIFEKIDDKDIETLSNQYGSIALERILASYWPQEDLGIHHWRPPKPDKEGFVKETEATMIMLSNKMSLEMLNSLRRRYCLDREEVGDWVKPEKSVWQPQSVYIDLSKTVTSMVIMLEDKLVWHSDIKLLSAVLYHMLINEFIRLQLWQRCGLKCWCREINFSISYEAGECPVQQKLLDLWENTKDIMKDSTKWDPPDCHHSRTS